MIQEQISLDTLGPYLRGIDTWSVYEFAFWDDQSEVNILKPLLGFSVLYEEVKNRFLRAGWEGDGEIEFGFLPPFCSNGGGTCCDIFFHVKQSNNGLSYILTEWKPGTSEFLNLIDLKKRDFLKKRFP